MTKPTITITTLLLLACTPKVGEDDDVASSMGESTTSSESSSESGGATTNPSESGSESGADANQTEGFVDTFDNGPTVDCDIWAQDCPVGEKCVPYSNDGSPTWNDVKCVPVMGEQAPGQPCTWGGFVDATDDCDATSICFDTEEVDGQLIGTCHAQCSGSELDPICPADSSCALSADATLVLCLPLCDPLAQDCEAGDGCFWANDAFHCVTAAANIPLGQPCGYVNDCVPGAQCLDAQYVPGCMDASCCAGFCDVALGDAECVEQPGTACTPFFIEGDAPAGYENVGVCITP